MSTPDELSQSSGVHLPYTKTFFAASERFGNRLPGFLQALLPVSAAPIWQSVAGWIGVFAVWVLLPAALFIYWVSVSDLALRATGIDYLRPSVWLAGSWIVLGPCLSVFWERDMKVLLSAVTDDTRDYSIPTALFAEADSFSNRLLWPTFAFFISITFFGMFASRETFATLFGIPDGAFGVWVIGVLIVLYLGLSFGAGVWGVLKCITLARAFMHFDLPWHPFTPRQLPSIELMASAGFKTGSLFSVGAVFVPATLTIYPDLPTSARVVAVFIVLVLTVGGAVAFAVPTLYVSRAAKRQRDACLMQLSRTIDRKLGASSFEQSGQDTTAYWSIEGTPNLTASEIVSLHEYINGQSALPSVHITLARISATVAIPAAVLLIERVLFV